ncbi:DUF2063 domain-containing protein [Roseibium sp. RKSG952]|uniref:HvfC/BufC N-terminal domain-containing protein n=1 Tax=Roseibium sp. RKSG952 TaxID=2529384 RepID=UPI0018AD1E00|nr:putative DNA-binding domain-containing protein [Roseibium sp. RKSG952]
MPADPRLHMDQSDFAAALLDPERHMPEGVIGPGGKPAPKRFNVYRNNVLVSLIDALSQTFPAIMELLGEEYFRALAKAFIARHPPESPVLMWYGAAFPGFVEAFPPLADYPYLADVARLEWLWVEAYHAEDRAVLNPMRLAEIDPGDIGHLTFERHPAAACLASRWPVLSLLRANRFERDAPPEIDLSCAEAVLVSRPDVDVQLSLLPPGGAAFWDALASGQTLQNSAIHAEQNVKEFNLEQSFQSVLGSEALTGFRLPDRDG